MAFTKFFSELTPAVMKSYVDEISADVRKLQDAGRENQGVRKEKQSLTRDTGSPFKVDDFVWLENPSAGYALQTPLLGPFVVSGVDSRYKYRIRDLFSKEEIPV
ncbi:hypothetical protein ADUPG1_005613, partial [Aduncisulcus paluster]